MFNNYINQPPTYYNPAYKRFMDDRGPGFNYDCYSCSNDRNMVLDKIKGVLSVKEFDILTETNFMSSGDIINKYILIIKKLMAQKIIGCDTTPPTADDMTSQMVPVSLYSQRDDTTSQDGECNAECDTEPSPLENREEFIGYITTNIVRHPSAKDVALAGVDVVTVKEGAICNYKGVDAMFNQDSMWHVIGAKFLGETKTNVSQNYHLSTILGKKTNKPIEANIGDTVDYLGGMYVFDGTVWLRC